MKKTSTPQKIIKIAAKEFAKHGFEGASINIIANKAHVNKAVIYYHFKNKEDLYEKILHSIYEDMHNFLESVPLEDKPPPEKIYTLMNDYIDFVNTIDIDLMKIMLRDIISGGKYFKKLALSILVSPILDKITGIVNAGKEEGVIGDVDPVLTFFQTAGTILFLNSLKVALEGTELNKVLFNKEFLETFKNNMGLSLKTLLEFRE